jgi:hypothetical protein
MKATILRITAYGLMIVGVVLGLSLLVAPSPVVLLGAVVTAGASPLYLALAK